MAGLPPDPFTYVGRVARDDTGKVIALEVFHREDMITVADGDEFITFTTVTDLQGPKPSLERES